MKPSVPGAFAATAILLAASPAFGQNATPRPLPKPDSAPVPTTVVAESAEKRFDIELAGATAEEAVQRLGEKAGHPINVIFTGDSAGTPLPRLQLRNVTVSEFFAAVKAAGEADQRDGRLGYEFEAVTGAPNIYTFSVTPPPQPASGYRTFSPQSTLEPPVARVVEGGATSSHAAQIAADVKKTWIGAQRGQPQWTTSGTKMAGRPPQKTTLFFDVSKILDKTLTIEDVTTAIRTGWAAAADGKEPAPEALKFHQESKLLIATGPPEHLEAVTNIVRLLEDRKLPSKDEQVRNIEGLRLRIEEEAQQNHRLQARLDEAEKIKDATVRELRDQIAKLEIELAKRGKSE